jgi:iron complex outermembrane receptor protein
MYRAGLEFRPAEDLLIYATYSTGIKSGAFSGTWSDLAGGYLPSKKEEVKSAELGVKSVLANRTVRLNAAAFHYDYVDLQGLAFDPVLFKYGLDNIGDATITGFEADFEWRPIAGLDLRAGYGYIDTELTKANPVLGNTSQVGNRLPNAPKNTVNAEIVYEWPVFEGMLASVGMDARHQSDVYFSIDNDRRAYEDAYTVMNARAGLKSSSDRWNAMAWIRNAADEQYFQEAFISSGANVLGNVGAPRTYGLTLTLRFE